MKYTELRNQGFTIVELLIVVVVIAILAAITIVSYNGMTTQSNNTAIKAAASSSVKLITAYISSNGSYPPSGGGGHICITTDSTCLRNNSTPISGRDSFTANLETIGTTPKYAKHVSDIRGGITYNYDALRMIDGVSKPAMISYYMFGINSDCGMPVLTGDGTVATVSSNKFSTGNIGSSGATYCVVSIDGPSHS